MARRITALLGMILLLGLVLLLAWRVYLHHAYGGVTDEPAVVSVSFQPA
jgi:hypothetical protein